MKYKSSIIFLLLVVVLVACRSTDGEVESKKSTTPPVVIRPTEVVVNPTESSVTSTAPPIENPPTSAPDETVAPADPEPTVTPAPPTATSPPPELPVSAISLRPVADGFTQPLYLTHAFDDRLFVVEQAGRVIIVSDGQLLAEPFLDIRDRVGSEASEQGLLSLAFHPDYRNNGRFFVNYTNEQEETIVSRFEVQANDPNRAAIDSEVVLLNLNQPYWNHNGGQLQFGPDGYLYVGMGDGGSAGDPQGNGQNPDTLLGALLRLDVDGAEPYAIPADNPFVADESGRNEIWAIGLRNPWRFSFDRLNGDLFVADVGQNLWEEINYLPAGNPVGANFGWATMEASYCYGVEECDNSGLEFPVAEYPHRDGSCSVTGGYVYRGQQFPEMVGNYFFADYCSGIIWGLFHRPDGSWSQTVLLDSDHIISSFGEDAAGELYVIDHAAGAILQIHH